MAETTPKGKKNKALYIGLGILALGGLIYFLMRKKGSSTSVTINIANYSASDYEPLTDAQIKAKIDEVNGLINELGVDETIKQLQSQIDSYMTDGSPESLAYASLLEDIIADIENQSRSTTNAVAPSDMTMGMGTTPDMTMGGGVPSGMVGSSPILSASAIDPTKYPLLSNTDLATELSNANNLVATKGVSGAISDLNTRANTLLASSNPKDQQLALLLQELIRLLGGLFIPNRPTTMVTTPSTADVDAFVDPATRPTTTPTAPTLPQLTKPEFLNVTYPLVPQTTLDAKVDEVNASVLANGLATTIANLIAQANALDKSTLPAERELGKVYYDMAATLDIKNNPANASKYNIKTQQNWRDIIISKFGLNTATPNINGFSQYIRVSWALYGLDFTEPLQTNYISTNRAVASRMINSLAVADPIKLLDQIVFNLTPLGNTIEIRPAR